MKNYITYGYQFIIGHFWGVIIKKELCDLVVKKYVNNQILSKSEDKKINLI